MNEVKKLERRLFALLLGWLALGAGGVWIVMSWSQHGVAARTAGVVSIALFLSGAVISGLIFMRNPGPRGVSYHALRHEEMKEWESTNPGASLASEERITVERLTQQLGVIATEKLVASADPSLGPVLAAVECYPPADKVTDVSPNEVDSTFTALCEVYRNGNDLVRSFIRSLVPSIRGGSLSWAWTLQIFSRRMAVRAARSRDKNLIRYALIAHAIENLSVDVRDNFVSLSLIFHCAATFHPEPEKLFEEVAAMSGPGISSLLRDFVQRTDRNALSWGWQEVQTPQGVGYIHNMR